MISSLTQAPVSPIAAALSIGSEQRDVTE